MTTIDTATSQSGRPAKQSGLHPVNIGHLVMGIAILGIVVVWILVMADAVTGDDIRWLLPVPWVLAGGAGLLATTRRRGNAPELAYGAHERGWVGHQPEPVVTDDKPDYYDDLEERLARAEYESQTRAATVEPAEPTEPTEPTDPEDPADPTDPEDPADPADPTDTKENDR